MARECKVDTTYCSRTVGVAESGAISAVVGVYSPQSQNSRKTAMVSPPLRSETYVLMHSVS